MRTIKFRGKDIATREWVYGFYTQGGFVNPDDGTATVRHIIDNEILHDVIPETVSQFTELYDANGKEIYEGDILKPNNWNIVGAKECFLVEHDSYSPRVVLVSLAIDCSKYQLDYNWGIHHEVVGNKWDNPELL